MFTTAQKAHFKRSQMNPARMFKNNAKYISEGIARIYLLFRRQYRSFATVRARVPALRAGLRPTRALTVRKYHIFT
jgi:hypothetical protein